MAWDQTYGGAGTDYGRSVAQTSDGGYIIAGYTDSSGAGGNDVYLIKTDSSGTLTWNKTYGGASDDVGYSVAQTGDGGYIISGETSSFGAGLKDVYLIKTNSDGVLSWNKTYGGGGDDRGYSVAQTGDGGYIIVGYTGSDVYLIKTDSGGVVSWSKTYVGGSIDYGLYVAQTGDGGYIITGASYPSFPGSPDVYLIKTDSSGTASWSKTYGGAGFDRGCSVAQTGDGGYIIAGETSSSGAGLHDVYLIKTDLNGTATWSKTFGGAGDDVGYSVVLTSDGGYIIAGETSSFGAGGVDVYIIKTDSNGVESWSNPIGGTGDELGRSVAQTGDGGYIVAGYTDSSGAGGFDVYLVRLENPAPAPAPAPSQTHTHTPGIVFLDNGVDISDCVRFYFNLRDINWKNGRYFALTINDIENKLTYARNFTIRHKPNWFVFYLCKDRFASGSFEVRAILGDWVKTKTIIIH